ncbi:MAG: hypothetical protein CL946_07425, partial [Ectothiorhodospiraceae bacterium]|nr:hypothetical protein [Ectothiorhodospiraceae bacterium]
MTAHIAKETFEIVTTTFEIERSEALVSASEREQYDELHKLLSDRMLYYLDGHLEQLMNILYRIDLD